jgi:HNH endonuclease
MLKPMTPRRARLFLRICDLAGAAVDPLNPGDGWPGIARVNCSGGWRRVAMHVSQITTHSRADYERRFQNPAGGELVQAPGGALPILLGLGDVNGQPVVVVVDGRSRVARPRRFSILFHVGALEQAALSGWAEYRSSTGEQIFAMNPRLLPAFVEAAIHGVAVDALAVADAAQASGLLEIDGDESAERTRTIVSKLVRRASFGKKVCSAYRQRCAMCGIALGLPEGAHIYPVNAPGSQDETWNGIALCRNHHRVFDLHRLWISPDDGAIRWHPEILGTAEQEPIVANFVDNTRARIALPSRAIHRPRGEMFVRRYELAGGLYEWAA